MSNSQEDFPINHPLNIHLNITLAPEEAKTGLNKIVEVEGRKINITIPPDVKNGTKIRAKGKGKNENPDGQTGDLYLIVGIEGTPQRDDWISSSPEDTEISYSPSRVTNYKTLKAIGRALKAFAYGSGGGAVLSIISALSNYGAPSSEFYLFLFLGITGILTAITFAFMSESINVILDIEANSRQAAKTLGRILKSQ